MIAATKGFVRKAGLVLAVSLPLISTQAHAVTVTVTVSGVSRDYELGSIYAIYNANTLLLQNQPWWGSRTAALEFANAFAATGSYPLGLSLFAFDESFPEFGPPTLELGVAAIFASQNGYSTSTGGVNLDRYYNFVTATSVPEINAGSLSQALLILFALWLVTWRRTASRVA